MQIYNVFIGVYFTTWHHLFKFWLICSTRSDHIWELPVGNYHGIRDNYHYPFFWVIVSVTLHDFIWKNYHRNQSDRYPFFLIIVNYPTFLINYHILNFQMYYQYLYFLPKYPNTVSKKKLNSAIYGIEVLIETNVSEFYNSFQ